MSSTSHIAALKEALENRILILDGAMGTMIQRRRFGEKDYRGDEFRDHPVDLKGCNDLLVLTQPEAILNIHREYVEAGSDIIETNSFNATSIAMADYSLEEHVHAMNKAAAELARQAAGEVDRPVWVAGVLGPTNRTASISPDVEDPGKRGVTFEELRHSYAEACHGLIEGGADILFVETIFDTLNAKAALFAIEEVFEARGSRLPIFVSATITDASGRTLSGQTPEAFFASIAHSNPLVVGLNCALGARELRPYVHRLSRVANCGISAHPNAGLPNEMGGYDESPEALAASPLICW